jgi:RNA polymerase sigma-70 factor, ECF subfamily
LKTSRPQARTAPKGCSQREEVERLYAAIRQLPEADVALVLLFLDDLSYRQMAEVLGISESNVGVTVNLYCRLR